MNLKKHLFKKSQISKGQYYKEKKTRESVLESIYDTVPIKSNRDTTIYSDVGAIILGEIVEKISGLPLNVFADSIMAESGSTITVTGSLNTTQNVNSADDITIGSAGAGGNKILNILTGGGESSIKLMEAGTVYGISQVYDGGNNQFYIKQI